MKIVKGEKCILKLLEEKIVEIVEIFRWCIRNIEV